MACYKETSGCGVYENRSCDECPKSKPPKEKNKKEEPEKEKIMDNEIIHYKGKDYKIIKRTDNENAEFFELIDSAIGKITEAKSLINYASVFSVNTEAVNMAYKIISSLNELYDFAEEKGLYKPVDASPKFYYYEVFYFYNRNDAGSFYLETPINIDEFANEDEFLAALVNNNDIKLVDVDYITNVEKINEKTYRSFHSEN